MQLHWHRRDLRVSDNRGLAATAEGTIGLFVFDEDVLRHASPVRVRFMLDSLRALQTRYHELGGTLLLAEGNPRTVVPALAADLEVSSVSWCQDYSGLARERDESVGNQLAADGVEYHAVHDAVHHEPGSITTTEGTPYKVFTHFSKKWHDRDKRSAVATADAGTLATDDSLDEHVHLENGNLVSDVPTIDALGFDDPDASVSEGGTAAARDRLETFCEQDIHRYSECRDYPAEECTSGLSPHLTFGTIGIRDVYAATEAALEGVDSETTRESVREFQDQLAWREFYAQVLYYNPDVVTENYREYEHDIEWENDPDLLEAWKRGETGYPIVDAGMRQLLAEAFMHNRLRMIVASFLTKDLLIDWRHGYAHFREHLVDHDTANDTGGWQWAASTGTDAQPYFRIFNPTTQGERYDPDAAYVARYVPELRDVDPGVVHGWSDLSADEREAAAPGYPAPVVDHAERRERALETFERARGEGGS